MENPRYQKMVLMSGLVPYLIRYSGQQYSREIRMEVAYFVVQLFCYSTTAVKLFVSCGGIQVLARCLDLNMEENKDINVMAIDCLNSLLSFQIIKQIDLLSILTQYGIPERLTVAIDFLAQEIEDPTYNKYLQKAINILCIFASGQPFIQESLCSGNILQLLFEVSRYLDLACLLKLCVFLRTLAGNQTLLNHLENVGIIPFCAMLIKKALDWEGEGVNVKTNNLSTNRN